MRMLLIGIAALALVAPAAAQHEPPEVLAAAVADIQRGFAQLHERTLMLDEGLAALCAAPSEPALATARSRFGDAVVAFSRVEFVRLGPLTAENRAERLLFWPDRKGIGLRQVQAILAEQDETATNHVLLRDKSVAVQGLLALEYVLFGTDAAELAAGAGFRCRYGHAVATALATVSREVRDAWRDPSGIASRFAQPQPGYQDFRTERESLEALVGVFAHGVEAIRDTRLLPFLGRDGAAPRPRLALFWRSGLTVAALRANFGGLADLFVASGIGQAAAAESAWVDNSIRFEFGNAQRAVDLVTLPVEAALADAGQRQAFDYLVIVTRSLQTLMDEGLAVALGLSVGFSSLDGD